MAIERIAADVFLQRLQSGNAFSAIEEVQRESFSADAVANAALMHELVLDCYWKHKDLVAVAILATVGIQYSVAQARTAGDAALVDVLRSKAKAMAYNLASFTWPGWAEPGISPSADQMALGLHAARFNLQLAVELKKPVERVRDAHWLLGAQLLANASEGNVLKALEEFEKALPPASDGHFHLYHGYELLARRMLGEPEAGPQWRALLQELGAQVSEDARSFTDQLTAACRVFMCEP